MELYLISVAIFIALVLMIEGTSFFIRSMDRWNPALKRVRKELTLLSNEVHDRSVDIMRKRRPLSEVPWLDRWLSKVPFLYTIDRLLMQADIQQPAGLVLLLSLVLAITSFVVIYQFVHGIPVALLAAVLAGVAPILYAHWKKKRRVKKFEQQLPDALTLIARALKAGHAFSGGLHMVTQEFENPIGGEFQKVLNEVNFGVGLDEALANLSDRVDCADLKFFAISIIIQKETGGNLAEILENIACLIRERFKLQGRVRSLSAEGRISSYILTGIPVAFAVLLAVSNPKFLSILTNDPIGRSLVAFAIFMMALGMMIMKKMVNIKV